MILNITLTIILNVFQIDLAQTGFNHTFILVFAAIFGMGGAFISLAMSKSIAKMSTGAMVITQPNSQTEQWLIDTVKYQAQRANIGMPEVMHQI